MDILGTEEGRGERGGGGGGTLVVDPERFALPRGEVGGGLCVGLGLRGVFGAGGRGGEGLLDCHDAARGKRFVDQKSFVCL